MSFLKKALSDIDGVKTLSCICNNKAGGFKEAPRKQVAQKIIFQRLYMKGTVTIGDFIE